MKTVLTDGRTRRTAACVAMLFACNAAPAEQVAAEPDAFLDYIEATGSQYIDTGVNAETGLKARIDMEWGAKTPANDDWSMLDAATVASASDNRSRIFLCHIYNQKPFFGYGLKQRGNPAGTFEFEREKRCEIVTDITSTDVMELCQNGAKTFSDGDREKYAANGTVNLNLNLYLFACNYGNKPNWPARAKLYECKIFKKNSETGELALLRHYLPCIKDGRAGLYDKANGTISYSSGSADFIAGPVLDKPLALVESLTSDGIDDNYQCFNTWVYGKSGLKSEVEVSPLNPTYDRGILACRETDGDTRFFMAYHYQTAFRFATGKLLAKSDLNVVAPQKGVRYVIKTDTTPGAQSMTVSANGGEAVEVLKDGIDYGSTSRATTNTLSLLATHRAYDNYFTSPVEAILYATKIWDGDELLRDFVPAIATNAEGVVYAGLYDKVAERIYKPISGNLKVETGKPFDMERQVGPVTNVLADVAAPKTRIGYIEANGTSDYFDIGVEAKDGVEMEAVMEWTAAPDDDVFIGARPTSGNTRFFLYNAWPAHSVGYAKDLPRINAGENTYHAPAAGTKYRIKSRLDDGEQFLQVSAQTGGAWELLGRTDRTYKGPLETGLSFYLFARNYIGKADSFAPARLYSLKIKTKQPDGSYALVRDFVPAVDTLTGQNALWDRASETYFYNKGNYATAGGGEASPLYPGMLIILK